MGNIFNSIGNVLKNTWNNVVDTITFKPGTIFRDMLDPQVKMVKDIYNGITGKGNPDKYINNNLVNDSGSGSGTKKGEDIIPQIYSFDTGNSGNSYIDSYGGSVYNPERSLSQNEILRWQENMSNTSHQREVQDLIAAGLNPVLSANSGANSYIASNNNQSLDIAKLQAITALKTAQMNMNNAQKVANIYAGATKYAADRNLQGTISSNEIRLLDSIIPF